MAKKKVTGVGFSGCALCKSEREIVTAAFKLQHGHKPSNANLPFINMATGECQAWFKPPVSILEREGSPHNLPICDRHTHERSGVLMCSACAKEEPHPLGYKREKKSKPTGKHNPAQTSLLDLTAA